MPGLGIGYQKLENDDLRESLGLDDGDEGCGILLTKVLPLSPADGILQKGDVLLAINGMSVSHRDLLEVLTTMKTLPRPITLRFGSRKDEEAE